MALKSPAVNSHRPSDTIRPGDYDILLGESLKQPSTSNSGLLSLRYNYRPEKGLTKSTLTKHKVGPRSSYKLVVEDEITNEPAYIYSGRDVSGARDESRQEPSALALVFDKSKSAFILEPISTSLDFNLASAPAEPDQDIHSYPQLSATKTVLKSSDATTDQPTTSPRGDGSESPDAANPYDYRHFLEEARDAAEHTAATGARSPLPGSRTPMSGMSSPVPGASRFSNNGANTPQSRPAPTSAPAQKKRKVGDHPPTKAAPPRSQPATASAKKATTGRKRGNSKPTVPLSKERISDSSDSDGDAAEMSDTITVARPHALQYQQQQYQQQQQQQQQKPGSTTTSKPTHRRYLSQTSPIARPGSSSAHLPRSPHIVVDAPSGLEIDMGSPPPTSGAQKKRARHLNRDAFRSQTGTPSLAVTQHSPPPQQQQQQQTQQRRRRLDPDPDSDIDMPDAAPPHHPHPDQDMLLSDEDDNDVEALSLGSPRTATRTIGSSHPSSRIQSVGPGGDGDSDDDDDAALAAELEAALDEEDENENQAGGVGLGISSSTNNNNNHNNRMVVDDEESEVSEEE